MPMLSDTHAGYGSAWHSYGGLTGLGGAAFGMIAGQMADDGEEAFEKKLKVQVFVCPQCSEMSFKYHGGL
ncbi:hypothetical protein [Acidithiobacillus sp.]|uniref:hypothetical protein n=1 Tax=Acidithiobacillus sp. TaxID=1872118 RepID=UPI0026365271|nr:hypothetical protein [Acidithiobacillus sp.]MDD2749878.1 hypothetical protein [Acidithiobacillus sp.]MDD5281022.1 hypothetical protein [Acidithiobacillus sp.]